MYGIPDGDMAVTDTSMERSREGGIGAMASFSASREPVLMVSYVYPSKPLNFQACHPTWERNGQKGMEVDKTGIGMSIEIKSEHLQTLLCFS